MTEEMWDLWESGLFVGDDAPLTRAVIQKSSLVKYGPWRSLVFGQTEPHYEIPNIKTVNIDNRHQSDAATMTMTILNQVAADPLTNLDLPHSETGGGPTRRELQDLAHPGYYSFRRGITPLSEEKWGHGVDEIWVDMFIPNRVIRTFQGYGTDGAVDPWDDTKLILTGTWLIDKVDYSTNGIITIHCRDAAKLLIEQRLYPPIIPVGQYPLEFCYTYTDTTTETYEVIEQEAEAAVQGGNVAKHATSGWDSSSAPWYGFNASVYGHRASHAFDGNGSTYWLSVGNSGPNQVWSFEWIRAITNDLVNQVRFRPKWGGYVCYVAVKENGVWQGTSRVPYGKDSKPAYPNGSDKLYVKKVNVPKNENWFTIDLPRTYQADEVWLIFTNLANSGLGTYKYRAGVIEFEVLSFTPAKEEIVKEEDREVETIVPGNINDYTDIIKILASWAGFYWPYGTPPDPILQQWQEDLIGGGDPLVDNNQATGRVWGDFAYSGAFPVDPPCIPPSFWDNKSVMDGINQIKEILGFITYVDAGGALVWRMPNIWRTGNFITGKGYIGIDSVRHIDEEKVIIDYGVSVDDNSLRSEIIVVSADDPTLHTAIQPGYVVGETTEGGIDDTSPLDGGVIPSAVAPQGDLALLGGQDRILLVPNYPFISQDEVDKFAYLVSLWIHWSYRKGKFRIPGNPAFEPDDQVQIFERVTSESYIHYLQGVRSNMDLDKGTWYLDVDTHWLGVGPDQTWIVNTYADMPPALYAYLRSIGEITEDGDPSKLPPGFDPIFDIPDFPDDVPRLDEDLEQIFPDPPTINYPYDDSWSDKDIADDIGSDYVTPPTPGSGGGSVNSRSEAWRYKFWGARGSDLATITFVTKGDPAAQLKTMRTTVPRASAPAFRLMSDILGGEDYNVFSCTAFAGTSRKIAGTNTYSAHAWGLAIDINPGVNECCNTSLQTWFARATSQDLYNAAQKIISIRTNTSNVRVFGWGGNWRTKKDWMHFEVVCTRAQMLEGVHTQ